LEDNEFRVGVRRETGTEYRNSQHSCKTKADQPTLLSPEGIPVLTIRRPSSLVKLVHLEVMDENFHILVVNALRKPRTQRRDHTGDMPTNIDAGKEQRLQAPYGEGTAFLGLAVADGTKK